MFFNFNWYIIKILKIMSLSDNLVSLRQTLDYYQKTYNNGESEVDDEYFDSLVKYYESVSGVEYKPIGAKSDEEEVPLPIPTASLDKLKDAKAVDDLRSFLSRYDCNELVCMDKDDGISVVCEYKNGILKCQKRGDGVVAPDISFIQQYVQFPSLSFNAIIRGELMLYESVFEEIKPTLIANGKKANNSRNVVSGACSRVNPDAFILSKCVFLPYAFYIEGQQYTQTQQLEYLRQYGFTIFPYITLTKEQINMESLFQYLEQRRKESPYRIDGTVLYFNIPISAPTENCNPHHAIAVKKDTVKFTYVRDCIWNITSKDGYLTPVIQIDPTLIITTVTNITLNNGRMIYNNKIGRGAYIAITQGGDVIPKFLFTITPGENIFCPSVPYHWNPNGVEILVDNPDNYPQIRCNKLKYFLDCLDVKEWGLTTILKLYNVGITNLGKLIRVKVSELMAADGIQEKGATRLLDELNKGIKNATMAKIMAGSCFFGEGIGKGTMEKFINQFPTWKYTTITYENILSKRDFGPVKARVIAENLPRFIEWLNGIPELEGLSIETVIESQVFNGYTFIFTGFTDDVLSQEIRKNGGIVKEDHWVNAVNVVVCKDYNSNSDKIKRAKNSGGSILLISKIDLENRLRQIRINSK